MRDFCGGFESYQTDIGLLTAGVQITSRLSQTLQVHRINPGFNLKHQHIMLKAKGAGGEG